MSATPESLSPDNSPLSPKAEEVAPDGLANGASSGAPPDPPTARLRGRRTLPSSPVERAKLEAQNPVPSELNDRSTQVAFALLFVVPVLIILLSLLLLFPFINSQVIEDPSGIGVQKSSNGLTPSR